MTSNLAEGASIWHALQICRAIFLVLTVIGMVWISPYNRLPSRENAPLPLKSLGDRPILQLELGRRDSDLASILSVGNKPSVLREASRGNEIDTSFFIPAYAGLLICSGLLLASTDHRWRAVLAFTAVAIVPIAAVCDWVENAGISKAIHHFETGNAAHPGDAMRISRPSQVKWALLTLALFVYGVAAVRQLTRLHRINAESICVAVGGIGLGLLLSLMLSRYWLEVRGS